MVGSAVMKQFLDGVEGIKVAIAAGKVVSDRLKNHSVQQTATQGIPDDMKKNKTPGGGDSALSAKLATAHADKSKSIETNEVGQVQTAKLDINDRLKNHWVQQTTTHRGFLTT